MTSPIVFAKTLVRGPQTRSFRVAAVPLTGWLVSEDDEQHPLMRKLYTDWHRVERALQRFVHQVAELRRDGWVEA